MIANDAIVTMLPIVDNGARYFRLRICQFGLEIRSRLAKGITKKEVWNAPNESSTNAHPIDQHQRQQNHQHDETNLNLHAECIINKCLNIFRDEDYVNATGAYLVQYNE